MLGKFEACQPFDVATARQIFKNTTPDAPNGHGDFECGVDANTLKPILFPADLWAEVTSNFKLSPA